MVTKVQEAIRVLAVFERSFQSARPLQLVWGGRRYELGKVDFLHITGRGAERVYHFSVSEQQASIYFKLAFYSHTLKWYIEEFEDGA